MQGIECEFVGRLGADPQTSISKKGKPWGRLRVCVQNGKSDDEDVEWISVTFFEKLVSAAETLVKGSSVYVTGRLRLASWEDKDGIEQFGLNCTAHAIQPVGKVERAKPKPKPKPKIDEDEMADTVMAEMDAEDEEPSDQIPF